MAHPILSDTADYPDKFIDGCDPGTAPDEDSGAEKHQRGYRPDAVTVDQRPVGLLVDIQLYYPHIVTYLAFQLFKYWVNHFARAAPGGVEVHQYRSRTVNYFVEFFHKAV